MILRTLALAAASAALLAGCDSTTSAVPDAPQTVSGRAACAEAIARRGGQSARIYRVSGTPGGPTTVRARDPDSAKWICVADSRGRVVSVQRYKSSGSLSD